MKSAEYKLRSGATLRVTTASFELAIALVEAVKRASVGRQPTEDIGESVISSPEVRRALFPVFDTVMWDTFRVTPQLFDDPASGEKARGDYFEICSLVIQFTTRPFFLTTSLPSTTDSTKE